VGLIVHATLYPELSQYQGKAMQYRLIGYPLGALAVIIFRQLFKKTSLSYPHKIDAIVTFIIVLDMSGNAFGLYGSIEWWDDIMHFVNTGLFSILLYLLFNKKIKNQILLYSLIIGVMSWLQIIWEILEYVTFISTNNKEIITAYRDTIGDLALGQMGAIAMCLYFVYFKAIIKKKS